MRGKLDGGMRTLGALRTGRGPRCAGKVKHEVLGGKNGRRRPYHHPPRALSQPASHPLALPGPRRPAEALLLRPPQVPGAAAQDGGRPRLARSHRQTRPPGPRSRRWDAQRGDWEREYQRRRGGGGGGSAHLDPPPRFTACVGVRPRPRPAPKSTSP